MSELFESIFTDGSLNAGAFLIVLGVSLVLGIITALVTKIKSESTKSFFISTAVLPACVSMVIMLVNGNIGAGVAVAGAFSLVRFRSAQGSAKEICIIFIDMTIGLALGMGYIAYAVIFTLIALVALYLFSNTKLFDKKNDDNERILKVLVAENMDYTTDFKGVFAKYTSKNILQKVKSTNMGAMFRLEYNITLKDVAEEKKFIDELRCHNGNLEIVLERTSLKENDL